eukprot:1108227-Ditylum_brightwellii.AAC.1
MVLILAVVVAVMLILMVVSHLSMYHCHSRSNSLLHYNRLCSKDLSYFQKKRSLRMNILPLPFQDAVASNFVVIVASFGVVAAAILVRESNPQTISQTGT